MITIVDNLSRLRAIRVGNSRDFNPPSPVFYSGSRSPSFSLGLISRRFASTAADTIVSSSEPTSRTFMMSDTRDSIDLQHLYTNSLVGRYIIRYIQHILGGAVITPMRWRMGILSEPLLVNEEFINIQILMPTYATAGTANRIIQFDRVVSYHQLSIEVVLSNQIIGFEYTAGSSPASDETIHTTIVLEEV